MVSGALWVVWVAAVIKPVARYDGKARSKYVAEVTLLQEILFYSAQAKKSNDLSRGAKLRSLLDEFKRVYFENRDMR